MRTFALPTLVFYKRGAFSDFVKDDITEFFGALQKSIEMGVFEVTPQITVKNRIHVANIMRRIRVMPDVQKVYRKK